MPLNASTFRLQNSDDATFGCCIITKRVLRPVPVTLPQLIIFYSIPPPAEGGEESTRRSHCELSLIECCNVTRYSLRCLVHSVNGSHLPDIIQLRCETLLLKRQVSDLLPKARNLFLLHALLQLVSPCPRRLARVRVGDGSCRTSN